MCKIWCGTFFESVVESRIAAGKQRDADKWGDQFLPSVDEMEIETICEQ